MRPKQRFELLVFSITILEPRPMDESTCKDGKISVPNSMNNVFCPKWMPKRLSHIQNAADS